MSNDRQHKATRLAQALHFINPAHGAVVPGIEPASTFARDADYAPMGRAVYGRDGGPTTQHAEAVLADLDGAEAAMLFASGMSAVVAVFETLRSGDHVVCPKVAYHGTITWLNRMAELRGITVSYFDASKSDALAAAVRPETKFIWIESPTNPNWDITDIAAAAKIAASTGAKLIFDATCCPVMTTRALDLGADIVFQSATKYLNGHSDLTGGVLSTRDTGALWDEMRLVRTLQGTVMGAFEAYLLIRGLRTLHLRWDRACRNAMEIATHFSDHDGIEAVLYPGLPNHPGHDVAARQMEGGFGGMLSLIARSEASARTIATSTRVFVPATSLGGVESLIEHRIAVEPPGSAVSPALLRLSVGIEDVRDLIADLEQAIAQAMP
ncbi:trans-sulfuration enzyme family protein [Pontivivens insulae]|uniref:Cystathionine gamma-synthase n=1 Tax=Pontivivens insulae TaxID=1639689 RepID=A0A2R8AA90_9RHOB|nr:PLP-dependent aspartate aminotransferase family protein [Pontivivens insulae]RED13052.1 cystathionine gamma-synthase [Pontivivens insulae]SPF29144.1 Cystathionine gamma-synthase [Pontivivens insulae]